MRQRKIIPIYAVVLSALVPGGGQLYLNDLKWALVFGVSWFITGVVCNLLLVRTGVSSTLINVAYYAPQVLSCLHALVESLALTAESSAGLEEGQARV